jgi:polysaccharide export outer membrane protein
MVGRVLARAAACASLVLLSGCAGWSLPVLPQDAAAPPSAAPTAAQAAVVMHRPTIAEFDALDSSESGELRFQPGDALKVAIWGYPELDHIAVVQPNGKVTLPLVGEVSVADATVAAVRQRIAEQLTPFMTIASAQLRPGDVLNYSVWRDESLRGSTTIGPSGLAVFPLIGSIRAADRDIEEIRAEAQKRMAEHVRDARVSILPSYTNRRVLQDHTVSVLAQQLQPRRIAIIGEVGLQGLTEVRGGTRLLDVLAQHQLKSATAQTNSIIVIRNPAVGPPRYRVVRLGDFLEGRAPTENIVLRNGDIVIVPKTLIAKVGEFVEVFLVRTLPAFQWWSALHNATTAGQQADTVRLINEALRRQLNIISISPNGGAAAP